MSHRGLLLVLSGPSGVGKGTLVSLLTETDKNVAVSISATTRAPRVGEEHGKSYFFLSQEEFARMEKNGEFLEFSHHFGNGYGTPKQTVLNAMAEGKTVILEIDVNGALAVKQALPESVLIMIAPPDFKALKERLTKRNTETEEVIANRISRAAFELSKTELYDYVVVNDNLTAALENIQAIILAEKSKTAHSGETIKKIMEE